MVPLQWPTRLLVPSAVKPFTLKNQSRGGVRTGRGLQQAAASPGGYWVTELQRIPIRTRDQVLAWRALAAQLDGRAGQILVPAYDWARAPALAPAGVPWSDGATWSDGSLWAGSGTAVRLMAEAAMNATSLAIEWIGSAPTAGQYFMVGTGELHLVAGFWPRDVAGQATVTIRPWLRADYAATTLLEMTDPHCLMSLATDDAMELDLEHWKFGAPSVALVEALDFPTA